MFTDDTGGGGKRNHSRKISWKTAAPEDATEAAILDAADRLLARSGYPQMQLDDLAKEAGVPEETLFLYFRNRHDVVLTHADRIARRLVQRLEWILDRAASPIEKLHEMLLLRILFRFDGIRHFNDSMSAISADLQFDILERREQYFREEARVFSQVLKEGAKTKCFRTEDPLATAYMLITATNSLLPLNLSAAELSNRQHLEKRTLGLIDLLLGGIVRRGETPASRDRVHTKKKTHP